MLRYSTSRSFSVGKYPCPMSTEHLGLKGDQQWRRKKVHRIVAGTWLLNIFVFFWLCGSDSKFEIHEFGQFNELLTR